MDNKLKRSYMGNKLRSCMNKKLKRSYMNMNNVLQIGEI